MKRGFLILISASAVMCLGLGGCISDLLFLAAPLLT